VLIYTWKGTTALQRRDRGGVGRGRRGRHPVGACAGAGGCGGVLAVTVRVCVGRIFKRQVECGTKAGVYRRTSRLRTQGPNAIQRNPTQGKGMREDKEGM